MRPVDKLVPGTCIYIDGSSTTISKKYPIYQDAKPALTYNLGLFCSYCEKAFGDERELAVEHIQAKKYKDAQGNCIYAHLETAWDNFLLSCPTCNGSDNKGNKNVIYGQCHLPHLNNTYLSFRYKAGGVVEVNPNLTGMSFSNANYLYRLVGLDKTPLTSRPKDRRWQVRNRNWNLANRYLTKYVNGAADVETIVDLVKGHGCWSIWFTVFIAHLEVRRALVEQFLGTSRQCFDSQYLPIPKNPSNAADPI